MIIDFLVMIYTEANTRFQTLAGLSTIDQQTGQVSSHTIWRAMSLGRSEINLFHTV